MQLTDYYKKKFEESLNTTKEAGFIERVAHPMVYANGLPGAKTWEVVYFETGHLGFITSLSADYTEIMLFSNETIPVGTQVVRSDAILEVPVGDALLGTAIDALCRPLNSNAMLPSFTETRLIDVPPLGLDKREKVKDPLETGISMIDFLVPLGKGQRELIIGDRNIGKTTFVMQTMLSQARKGTICIYAAIGKKQQSIKQLQEFVTKHDVADKTIIIGAGASDPIGYIYIAPYTAMTLAEYFRDKGLDTVVILDDLTTHAKYYREISLISRKFPGRDSYPGDVFFAHARLLERAGNFNISENKCASISCLPVAETVGGDISGYIQTNLMSITDGHIFFDLDMYKIGKRPAINHFLSVTRVGRQTQSNVRWGINRELSSFLLLHDKTQRFIHFGAELNEGIKATLVMGKNISFFFDQSLEEILDITVQIIAFTLIWVGILKEEDEGKIKYYITTAQRLYMTDPAFKERLDTLVNSCTDFNQLLGKVSAEHKDLLSYMDAPHESK